MNRNEHDGQLGRYAAKNTLLIHDNAEILRTITELIGLKLAIARRAADLCVLHFGTMRLTPESIIPSTKDKPRGMVGDFALHIQCSWRIESDAEIVTGHSDL